TSVGTSAADKHADCSFTERIGDVNDSFPLRPDCHHGPQVYLLGLQCSFRTFRFEQPLETNASPPCRLLDQFYGQAGGSSVFPLEMLRWLILVADPIDSPVQFWMPHFEPAHENHERKAERDNPLPSASHVAEVIVKSPRCRNQGVGDVAVWSRST